jgi:hypothetical protein
MSMVRFYIKSLNITIYNEYSGLELTSPVYFSTSTVYCVSPTQQTEIDYTVEISFGMDSKQDDSKCALLYKLQRKHATKTDNQHNNSNTLSIEGTETSIYLLVVWDVKYQHSCVCLIECTNDFTWDEDKLWALYREYNKEFYEDYQFRTITWLMNNGEVMETSPRLAYESDYKLSIFIFKEDEKDDMKRPMKIDPKR